MMKKTTQTVIVSVLLAVIFFSAIPVSAIGNIGDCYVYFSIKNNTNDGFVDKITVKMSNPALNLNYSFEISYLDYTIGYRPVVGVVKTGEYTIQLEYFSVDKYVIKNIDGTAISSLFSAKEGEHTFEWSIEPIVKQEPQTPNEDNSTSFMVSEEADELYQKYIKSFASILAENKDARNWVSLKNRDFEFFIKTYEKRGRDKIFGRTKEELQALNFFEKAVAQNVIFQPYIAATFYRDWEGLDFWNKKVLYMMNSEYNMSNEMGECYKALMEWSYYYYVEHGVTYDFLKNATLLHGDIDYNISDEAIKKIKEEYPDLIKDYNNEQGTTSSESSEVQGDSQSDSQSDSYIEDVSVPSNVENELTSEPMDIELPSENKEDDSLWGESVGIFMRGVVFTLIMGVIAVVITLIIFKRRAKK